MGIKETINKFTKKDKEDNKEIILLDTKIDKFINWYQANMVMDKYTGIGEYFEPRRIRDTIEKMAVWFELRYSSEDINSIFNSSRKIRLSSNDIMFKYNQYVNDLVDNNDEIKCLDWNDFYNYKVFFRNLSWEEKWFLVDSKYPDIVYLRKKDNFGSAHFHLDSNGIIIMADDLETIKDKDNNVLFGEDFVGKSIIDSYKILKDSDCNIDYNEIKLAIENYNNKKYLKDEFLNCVMYRIIERGGNRIGPRRALLFAKEFNRNIDIPMKYGVDLTDSDLRFFMNEFFKLGGNSNLECYLNYFYRSSDKEKFETINMQDLLKKTNYTGEEQMLHQKLVNSLNKASLNKVKKNKENILKERVVSSSNDESTNKIKKLVK